jgi:hypothetical protein
MGAAAPGCDLWLQFSDWAGDAGDRSFNHVLAVAVAEAMVLAAVLLWAMPSFGWPW